MNESNVVLWAKDILRRLEFREGDIFSADELVNRISIARMLDGIPPHLLEDYINEWFEILTDSSVLQMYYKFEGTTRDYQILKAWANGKTPLELNEHPQKIHHIARRFLKDVLK